MKVIGDSIPLNAPEDLNIMSWLRGSDLSPGHLSPRVDPIVSAVVNELRFTYGVEQLGGVGYCFGAKYVVRFLHDGIDGSPHLNAGFVAHPSFVTAEELKGVSRPFSIAAGYDDPVFPVVKRRETEQTLGKVSIQGHRLPWQLCLYSGVDHGFAVRCDTKKREQRFAMDQAFRQAVAWFDEFLPPTGSWNGVDAAIGDA
jgi:dienelactone hydrolase